MSKMIPFQYDGEPVRFYSDGWVNATDVAKRFGKKPAEWLRLPDTVKYMRALARHLNVGEFHHLIRSSKGRNVGTWLHPKLAVTFARWLYTDFAVWCDLHIDALLRGEPDVVSQYASACQDFAESAKVASGSARRLAEWRWGKQAKRLEVERLAQQLQLILDPQ